MEKILLNKIKCNLCNDIIESTSVHDFKFCKCGAIAVDGGHDYLKRCGNRENWEELSEFEEGFYGKSGQGDKERKTGGTCGKGYITANRKGQNCRIAWD